MKRLPLIIETGDAGFWGRVTYENNLIVDQADTIAHLVKNMKILLLDFHELKSVDFAISYDLSAFFEQYNYLNISKIADYAGMNPGLLRHYKAGSKNPSADQVKRIEDAVHKLAEELANVHLVAA